MADKKKSVHVKTGDRVVVITGSVEEKKKCKGTIGNVKKVLPAEGKVIVEGANMITKATKANPAYGIQGGLIQKEAPIDASNVMIICPSCEKTTRVAHKVIDGKKFRVCKKCGEKLDLEY